MTNMEKPTAAHQLTGRMSTWTTGRCPCSDGCWVVCRQLSLGELWCSLRESVCYRNIQLSALLLCCLSSCSSAENSGTRLGSHFFNTNVLLLHPVNLCVCEMAHPPHRGPVVKGVPVHFLISFSFIYYFIIFLLIKCNLF